MTTAKVRLRLRLESEVLSWKQLKGKITRTLETVNAAKWADSSADKLKCFPVNVQSGKTVAPQLAF